MASVVDIGMHRGSVQCKIKKKIKKQAKLGYLYKDTNMPFLYVRRRRDWKLSTSESQQALMSFM